MVLLLQTTHKEVVHSFSESAILIDQVPASTTPQARLFVATLDQETFKKMKKKHIHLEMPEIEPRAFHMQRECATTVSAVYQRWFFLAVAEGKGKGGKTLVLKVKAEGEAEGLVFCI